MANANPFSFTILNQMKNIEYNINMLGFTENLAEYRMQNDLQDLLVGRVILEHRERYAVLSERGELDCELLGNLRYAAQGREDLPAVGDWVAINEYDPGKGLIHALYPRKNLLERQANGKAGARQIIAANIDYGLIVQSVNRDFSINRMERYITICHAARIEPVLLLNKVDLIAKDQLAEMLAEVRSRIEGIAVIPISNLTGEGMDEVTRLVKEGYTYCLLGSSGAGKSTLINRLADSEIMKTGVISEAIDRGKHVTTHRELVVLPSGGVLIDNPGMREVGTADSIAGLEMTFEKIYELSETCKFKDCSHQQEKGCAILAALEAGELKQETYDNFMRLEREQAHFSTTVYEKRKKEKAFGKIVKQAKSQKSFHRK
jgi:ribosome biogenesis GTPase